MKNYWLIVVTCIINVTKNILIGLIKVICQFFWNNDKLVYLFYLSVTNIKQFKKDLSLS